MSLAENLRTLMELHGDNPHSLGEAVGVAQPNIFRIVEGITKDPRRKTLEPIAKRYGITVDELVNGARGAAVQPAPEVHGTANSSDGVVIEQYHSTRGSQGKGFRMAGQPGHISRMQVSDKWAEMNLPRGSSAENLKLVTGFGDMMKGTFNPGDPLLVDVSVNEFAGSGIYFFRIGDDAYMSRLQQVPGVGLRSIPDSKAYEPWSITPDMDFEIIGLLVKAWEGKQIT